MTNKVKKVQISGENNLKVNLWGNLINDDVSSQNRPINISFKKPQKRFRIKGRLLKSGKGLKPVTEIYEWPTHISKNDLNAILLKMKQSFGCGGTIKAHNKSIELQGDKFDQSESFLNELGFTLIRSGG